MAILPRERDGAAPPAASPAPARVQPESAAEAALASDAAYWREKLAGVGPAVHLPLDRPRGTEGAAVRAAVEFALAPALGRGLDDLCNGNATLLLVAFLTGVKAALYRATGRRDVVVGTAVHDETRHLEILNRALLLRDLVAGGETLKDLLLRVKQTLAEAYAHPRFPCGRLADLVEAAEPLCRVAVVVEAINDPADLDRLGTDLTLAVRRQDGRLVCRLEHAAAVLDAESAELFGRAVEQVLAALVARSASAIDDLPLPAALLARRERAAGEAGPALSDPPAGPAVPGEPANPRAPRDGALPLSFAQRRLWLLQQIAPQSVAYNLPLILSLEGALDASALERSLHELVCRHESLRTSFPGDAEPVQRIHSAAPATPLPRVELGTLPAGARAAVAHELLRAAVGRPFDLVRGPLLRLLLISLGPERHLLLFGLHHIACDGWSLAILTAELVALYPAFAAGRPSPLRPPPLQYADFAVWQRTAMTGERLAGLLAFWRERLAGIPAQLELPADRPVAESPSERGAAVEMELPPELAAPLAELAGRSGATPFMVLLAVFKALLWHYTGQEDLVVGTPIANRGRVELEGVVGFFVNTLVLRTSLLGDPDLLELVRRVRAGALDAYAHQDLPFERLVEELAPARDHGRTPLFQVGFALQRPRAAVALPDLVVRPAPLPAETAKFDLLLTLSERGAGLAANLEFSTDRFDPPTARRLLLHFRALLRAAVSRPADRLSAHTLLSAAERWQLSGEWNDTASSPGEETFPALLSAQVERSPDAVAVACGTAWLSYAELDRRAGRLARLLRSLGVGPDSRVAVSMPRTPELVTALVGILRAGGAYVPLDPSYPPERLRFMLADALGGMPRPLLLTTPELAAPFAPAAAGAWPLPAGLQTIDAGAPLPGPMPTAAPGEVPTPPPESLAYVIYTSGSTGRPKGVMVHHRGLANYLAWCQGAYRIDRGSGAPVHSSESFDLTVTSLFAPLLAGRAVILLPEREGVAGLTEAVRSGEPYSFLKLTPSHLKLLDQLLPPTAIAGGAGVVVVGGEALHAGDLAGLERRSPEARVVNEYGPTETVVGSAVHERAPDPLRGGRGAVPIGRPIANTRILLLDRDLSLCPLGGRGEIYIGGAGVARGYLGRSDLTAERFVPDPFAPPGEAGARLYRTGDLARRQASGELAYLGRIDEQVKIRGLRIELAEVEAALSAAPGVRRVAVVLREGSAAEGALVACVVPRRGAAVDAESLRAYLEARLPAPMIPAHFVALGRLPLTPNGKVDRLALAKLEPAGAHRPAAAARTPCEEIVGHLFAEVLGAEAVGPEDSFFALGGHSLLAAQLAARVRAVFGIDLLLREVFAAPTAAGLARRIAAAMEEGRRTRLPHLGRAERSGPLPLSFGQERLWFLHQLDPASAAYNVALPVAAAGDLSPALLARSLEEVARRHEVLRTRFAAVEGRPVQVVEAEAAPGWCQIDLRSLSAAAREGALRALLRDAARRPFALDRLPLVRLTLLRLGDREWVTVLALHHIVADAVSLGILLRETCEIYRAARGGRRPALAALQLQYGDFAIWQRGWMRDDLLAAEVAWWRARLTASAALELPTDRPRAAQTRGSGASLPVRLAPAAVQGLRALARKQGATLFMGLLAAFQALLARYTSQMRFNVGTPAAVREPAEVEGLIGFFVNTLVLPGDLGGGPGFGELTARAREGVLSAHAHQAVPFERLVLELAPQRDLTRSPLFDVMLGLSQAPLAMLSLPDLALTPLPPASGAAKFDLSLLLVESGAEVGGILEYRPDLFDVTTARRIAAHWDALLAELVRAPERRFTELPMLLPGERAQLLAEWNDTAAPGATRSVPERFAAQVLATPHAVAVTEGEESLSYAELSLWAEALARDLRRHAVGPETRVAVCLSRSPALVAALLAVWKAGGAYVPLDPALPPERLRFLIEDALGSLERPVLITEASLDDRIPPATGAAAPVWRALAILRAEREGGATLEVDETGAGGGAAAPPSLESLACVYYTSGSSGRPKGVLVHHRGLASYLDWCRSAYPLAAGSGAPVHSSAGFDLTVTSLFAPLIAGRTVALLPEEDSAAALAQALRQGEPYSLLKLTPSHLRLLDRLVAPPALLAGGTLAFVVGGEALLAGDLAPWRRRLPGARFYNEYGPTETVVGCAVHRAEPASAAEGAVPIGRPIANMRLYLLAADLGPVPLGGRGEVYIGGCGVTRGYLERPDLTAERFLPDPFAPAGDEGGRLYRTGDLARRLPHGEIEYLGRLDDQVKIRGHRVEPGEVEAVLAEHPRVRQAAVLAQPDPVSGQRLVAWVELAGEPGFPIDELRSFLAARLPEPMVPALVCALPALPLAPSGKVDRSALRGREATPLPRASAAHAAPRSPLEQTIAEIWREVLGIEPIGTDETFFQLGGHSLALVEVHARLCRELDRDLPLTDLFRAPTIAGLARYLGGEESGEAARQGEERAAARRALRGGRRGRARDLATAGDGSQDGERRPR